MRRFLRKLGFSARNPAAEALYATAVGAAREPAFYVELGVPDTATGRFDLIVLHVFFLIRRLREADSEARDLAQDLFDHMFADMDRSLREMGVGDLSVGRQVKALAQGFYGRSAMFEAALAAPETDMAGVLRRNLYGGDETVSTPDRLASLSRYIEAQAKAVATQDVDDLKRGLAVFPVLPTLGATADVLDH